jgi:L-aspartate oxidase
MADAPGIIVIGGGVAGLATALKLAPRRVTLISAGRLMRDGSTVLAQGGIAAAIGPDDAPALHADDTLAAAAGLGDAATAQFVTAGAPSAIEWLVENGVRFDRDTDGAIALGREAAHGRSRIVHANGDRTGFEVMRALTAAVRSSPSIDVIENTRAQALLREGNGRVVAVQVADEGGSAVLPASAVVLATGGVGGLYAHTTNPLGNVGSGLALAARAGAALRDLEFVQFHPTAIDVGRDPMPLATEALRGAGARLVDAAGDDVMAGIDGGALAARDVVASTIYAKTSRGQRVYLELPEALMPTLGERFPGLVSLCAESGIDLATRRVPVRAAVHYHMGGVWTDLRGRTSLAGLWACGEVASTGLHGANRLASNSLLEGLVFAGAIARDIEGQMPRSSGVPQMPPPIGRSGMLGLRRLMDERVGVVRHEAGLSRAVREIAPIVLQGEADDESLVALMIAVQALARRESRGSHRRSDWPQRMAEAQSQMTTLSSVTAMAREIAETIAAE